MSLSWPDVAALVPALDEEEALPGVIHGLARAGVGRVLVVDNGSRDGTAEAARRAGAHVIHEPRRGYGAACLAGLREMDREDWDAEVVLFLDGDGSDDPAALPLLVEPIRAGTADLVVGARRSGTGDAPSHAIPLHARAGNALVLGAARLLHRAELRDLGPFRAIGRRALEGLEMDDTTWGWTLQMQLRAHHAGLRVRSVPVPHRERQAGRSKVSGSLVGSVRAGARMLATLVTELPAWRRAGTRGPVPGSDRAPLPEEGARSREG
jgi:glycosyltransferase involved in cell wall biosynthesis